MNNTQRAACVRTILSKQLTDFEKSTLELYQSQYAREIIYTVDALEVNEENKKILEAISFLLKSLKY